MWIGERCDDIVDVYAYTFARNCTVPCIYEGVCAAIDDTPLGGQTYVQIGPAHPLHRCRHFMAAVQFDFQGPDSTALAESPFEAFMRSQGRQLLGTTMASADWT